MFIRLHKDTFFRQYKDIGYLWQQKERRSLVLDKNGAVFFGALTRDPQKVSAICAQLVKQYTDVSAEQLEKDFMEFMQRFVHLNMVVMAVSAEDIAQNEKTFSYAHAEEYQKTPAQTNKSIVENDNNVNQFLTEHFKKYPQLLSLQIEITPHCNLKCVHCYLGFGTPSENQCVGLTTPQLFKVLDEFRALGGLQVTFTGGEAMLNKDLPALLRYARQKDLDVSVLTNATLLTDNLLHVMKEINISHIQVSLYSMIPEVHDAITQVNGSFEKSKRSIEQLIAADIPVQIGCPVMKENLDSFQDVLKWGQEKNLRVKLESQIIARADFTNDNLLHRLTLREQSYFIEQTLANNLNYQERLLSKSVTSVPEDEPVCSAGRYMLCLDAAGDCYPCTGFKLKLGNCKEQTLQEIWENSPKLNKLRNLTNAEYGKCLKCPSRTYCNLCPGKLYNESGGDMFELSDYFCEVAHINRRIAEEFVAAHKADKK